MIREPSIDKYVYIESASLWRHGQNPIPQRQQPSNQPKQRQENQQEQQQHEEEQNHRLWFSGETMVLP